MSESQQKPEIFIELRAPKEGASEKIAYYFDTEIILGGHKFTIYGGVIFHGREGGFQPQLPSKQGKDKGGEKKSYSIVHLSRELWDSVMNKARLAAEARERK